MDEQKRTGVLDALAEEASAKREAFLDDAGSQFASFLEANEGRLKDLGGLVLINEEPDYLFVSQDGSFRSRTRLQDDDGEWVTETEDIEDAAELVELYNPSDLYAAFADAAELQAEADTEEALEDADAEAEAETDEAEADVEAEAELDEEAEAELDDDWVENVPVPRDKEHAARLMYDLALTFQERSQLDQAQLLDDFQEVSGHVAGMLGDNKVVDDEEERLWFRSTGAFEGEVVPERDEDADGEPEWQTLTTPDEMVQFYDPTDLFGDLAEAVAEAYPGVAPELDESGEPVAVAAAGESDED